MLIASPFSYPRADAEIAFVGLIAQAFLPGPGASLLTADAIIGLRDSPRGHPDKAAHEWAKRFNLAAPCVVRWAALNLRTWRGDFDLATREFVMGPMFEVDDATRRLSEDLRAWHHAEQPLPRAQWALRAVGAQPHLESEGEFIARAKAHYRACQEWLAKQGYNHVSYPTRSRGTAEHAEWTLRYQMTGSYADVAESIDPDWIRAPATGRYTPARLEAVRSAVQKFAKLIELPLRPASRGPRNSRRKNQNRNTK
jgi:hypothetical protein